MDIQLYKDTSFSMHADLLSELSSLPQLPSEMML